MVYSISYDLNGDDSNEQSILSRLDSLGNAKICMANVVLLDFEGTSDQVYDNLVALLKAGDRLFINSIEKDKYAGRTYKSDGVWGWLRERFQ